MAGEETKLAELYRAFDKPHMVPLWTEIGELMPESPRPAAVPYTWKWADLLPLAEDAGALVPVGRGGERRAIALATPAWAAGRSSAPRCGARSSTWAPARWPPEHRHSQNAFRFVVEGEGCGPS